MSGPSTATVSAVAPTNSTPTGDRPAARSGRWQAHTATAALGTLGVVLAVGLWEAAARLAIVSPSDIPPATQVLRQLAREIGTGQMWGPVWQTLTQWAIGMGVTVAIALPLGLLMGSVEPVWRALRPIVEFLRPVPGMALIPLTVLLWGLSPKSVIFLIAFGSVWSLAVAAMYGAHSVDQGARDTARAFRLGRRDRIRFIVLPSAAPHMATGLRVASGTALMIAVGGELVIGVPGLGYEIAQSRTGGEIVRMYSSIVMSGVLGIAIHLAFSTAERHFLRWHQSRREARP